jgi:hypothetical protein
MSDATLVDSNILLRMLQPLHTQYALAGAAVASLRQQRFELCIVPQNLVEFWSVATRPLENNGIGLTPGFASDQLRNLRNLFRLLEGASGIAEQWEVLVCYKESCSR